MLKKPTNTGLKKLPTEVRNKMGYMNKGGMVKGYKSGGSISRGQYPIQTTKIKFKGVF
jgi:hypothetical protein